MKIFHSHYNLVWSYVSSDLLKRVTDDLPSWYVPPQFCHPIASPGFLATSGSCSPGWCSSPSCRPSTVWRWGCVSSRRARAWTPGRQCSTTGWPRRGREAGGEAGSEPEKKILSSLKTFMHRGNLRTSQARIKKMAFLPQGGGRDAQAGGLWPGL